MLPVVTGSKHSAQNGFTPTDPILRQPNTRRKHDFTPTDPILRRLTTRSKPLFLRRVFAPSNHWEHFYYTPDGFLTLLTILSLTHTNKYQFF